MEGSTTTKRKKVNDVELSGQTSEPPSKGERTIMPTIVIHPTSTEPITIYVLTTRVDGCRARPGRYIRQNMLIALPEQAGHRAPNKILHDDVIPEALILHLKDELVVDVIRNSER